MASNRTPVPVSFFGIAVGLLALGNAWRLATPLWHLSSAVAPTLLGAGLVMWLAMLVLYAHKWLAHRDAARAELEHPIQSSFAALVPVSSLLAAMALISYAHTLALAVFGLAIVAQFALGMWLYGRCWQGGRKPEQITAAAYLPAVAQNFVAGTAAASFSWPHIGTLFFGAGLFSWVALESLILSRAATQEPMPEALRPVLGIQLAPAVVGGVTWTSINGGVPDLFAQILFGYGLYQAVLLLRLLPWIARQSFTPAYWAFSFGVAALPTLAIKLVAEGLDGGFVVLAAGLFAAANLAIGLLAVKTFELLMDGRLLPVNTPLAR